MLRPMLRSIHCTMVVMVVLSICCTTMMAQNSTFDLDNLQVINSQNAGLIKEVASLGVGMYGIPFWSSDEQEFYFPSTAGIWQYSMSDLQHPFTVSISVPPLVQPTIDYENVRSKTFVTYSPDQRFAVFANGGETGGSIYLFIEDAKTHVLIQTLYADKPTFRTYSGILFIPQFYGDDLFYLSKKMLYRWNPTTGQEEMLIEKPANLAISPNGNFVINFTLTATADSPISFKVYRLEAARAMLIFNPSYSGTDRWQSLAFAPDGQHISTGGNNGNVRIWDVLSQGSRYFDVGKPQEFAERQIIDLAYSHDGRYVAGIVTTVGGSYAFLLDAQTRAELARINSGSYNGINFFSCLTFHPQDNVVAFGGADGSIRLWDMKDLIAQHNVDRESASRVLLAHSDLVSSIVFSKDGNKLASSSWDKTVRVWDYHTGVSLLSLNAHSDQVWAVDFNPQATLLASGGDDGAVKLWDLATQKAVLLSQIIKKNQYSPLRISDLAFNHDGTVLATVGISGDISLFDVATHQQITTFNGGNTIWHITYNQAGTLLASASAGDTSVRLWGIPQQ